MFRRIAKRMGKLLLEVAAERPNAVADAPAGGSAEEKRSRERFETRGRQALTARRATSPTVLAGTVQLLGLDEVRKAMGGGWSQVADQAHAIASRVIANRLGPDDLFSLHENDSYVLCFPHLEESAARRKTGGIAAEIKSEILKAVEGGERIGVAEFVAEVEFAPALDSDRPLAEILAESLKDIRKEAEDAYQRHRVALLKEAEVFFRPVWHAAKRTVDLYRSVLDERTGRFSLDYLRSLSTPEEIQAAMSELDMLIFSHTIKELHRSVQSNGKGLFLIPVHFNTVNVKQLREEYLKLCHTIPESYKSFAFLELYGIPAGTPASRLRDLAPILRPACQGVVLEIPLTERSVEDFRGAGVHGLSADVRAGQDNPAVLQQKFARANKAAQEAGLQTIAHGADTMGLLQESVRAGFAYVSGHGIAPSADKTRGSYPLSPIVGTVAGRREALRSAGG